MNLNQEKDPVARFMQDNRHEVPDDGVTKRVMQQLPRRYERIYRPQDLGFMPACPDELSGGGSRESAARIFDQVLQGQATPAQQQCVIVNAAFAIQVLEPEKEIAECISLARESLESGRALKIFRKFIEINIIIQT